MRTMIIPEGKENDFKTVATTQTRKRRVRNKAKMKKVNYCSECGFRSDRAYNVLRHHERFHQPMKRRITCCDIQFLCKADYYRHCAKFHPNKRKYTLMTRMKYKITGSDDEKNYDDDENVKSEENEDEPARRKSLRRISKLVKTSRDSDLLFDFHFNDDDDDDDDDDTFPNFWKKSKKKGMKKRKSKSVKILFRGNFTSSEQAKIQSEFLADIDFESFKLPLTFKTKDRSLRLA